MCVERRLRESAGQPHCASYGWAWAWGASTGKLSAATQTQRDLRCQERGEEKGKRKLSRERKRSGVQGGQRLFSLHRGVVGEQHDTCLHGTAGPTLGTPLCAGVDARPTRTCPGLTCPGPLPGSRHRHCFLFRKPEALPSDVFLPGVYLQV